MNDLVYKEILLDIQGMETAASAHTPSSAGTFSLRRANYYSREGKLLLNAEQVRTMADLLPGGSPDAKRQLLALYLRKVVRIARRYTRHGLALLELIGEGVAGLTQALKRFEFGGKGRFSRYASQCIRRHIEQAIMGRNSRFPAAFRQEAIA